MPAVALGAIGTALVGAAISLVGLIVAKESKVSDFRQSWIDALRGEFSCYLANVSAAADARSVVFKNSAERFEKLHPFYSKLNETYYLIALRLNSSEVSAQNVRSCMVRISQMAMTDGQFDVSGFESERVEFLRTSNLLLRAEWARVKRGEPVYRATCWIAAISVIILSATAIGLIVANQWAPQRLSSKAEFIGQETVPATRSTSNDVLPSHPSPAVKLPAR